MAYFGIILAALLLIQGIAGASVSQKTENVDNGLSTFALADDFARTAEFPYHVSVQTAISNGVYVHLCSGVLISEKHVLTAASCYVKDNKVQYLIKAGSVSQTYKEPEVQTFFIEPTKSFVHENYDVKDKFSDNDIAILTLMNKINETSYVKPLKLSSKDEKFNSSLKYTVTGWGLDTDLGIDLKIRKVYVINNDLCKKSLSFVFAHTKLNDNQICTTSPANDLYTQDGDSGNPIVRIDKNGPILVGVASAVTKYSTQASSRLIFTKIPAYVDWIKKKQGNGASGLTYGYFMIAMVAFSLIKNLFN